MTEQQFQEILRDIRDGIVESMRYQGFYEGPPPGRFRYDATPYDVNQGGCEFFSHQVEEAVPEAEMLYVDTFTPTKRTQPSRDVPTSEEVGCAHAFIKWRGKYYDAECISGVKDWRKLPLFRNIEKSRAQVLRERKRSGEKDCI